MPATALTRQAEAEEGAVVEEVVAAVEVGVRLARGSLAAKVTEVRS